MSWRNLEGNHENSGERGVAVSAEFGSHPPPPENLRLNDLNHLTLLSLRVDDRRLIMTVDHRYFRKNMIRSGWNLRNKLLNSGADRQGI